MRKANNAAGTSKPAHVEPSGLRVAIIGAGYVGLVTGACLAEVGHEVICVDNDVEKVRMLQRNKMPIYEPGLAPLVRREAAAGRLSFTTDIGGAVIAAQVIFIAVGTPPTETGSADLSYIEAVSRVIAQHLPSYRLIVEKSTVPVQTGDRVRRTIARYVRRDVPFDVASNPEFLREGVALKDFRHPERIVIGVSTERARKLLLRLYAPFRAPIVVTDIQSAELIKHASNSFLAMKISYINAVATICELSGANVVQVARGMGMDSRIGPRFLDAGVGFGGSCFPKDVEAFARIARELGFEFRLLEEVLRINKEQRDRFVQKMEKELWILKGKCIAVLGLAFKPDTDDTREAPAIEIIRKLTEKGAHVRAYDPKGAENARRELRQVQFCNDAYEAVRGADCLALLTDWKEFAPPRLDMAKVLRLMAHPTILDGRNLYDPEEMRKLGFTYIGMGIP